MNRQVTSADFCLFVKISSAHGKLSSADIHPGSALQFGEFPQSIHQRPVSGGREREGLVVLGREREGSDSVGEGGSV